ncbi:MAG: kelch repeat-containing protein [Elusimicrobiota bacterium]
MVIGGVIDELNAPTKTVEIYDMVAADWTAGESMNTDRSSHTATLLGNGRVLVTGGFSNGTPLKSAEIYNPATGHWTDLGEVMISARGGHTATLFTKGTFSGAVLVCGGKTNADITATDAVTKSCEKFTPAAEPADGGVFSALTNMTSPRMGHTASLLNSGSVFFSGGLAYSGGLIYLSTNEIYDPETNIWMSVSPLLQGRTQHSSTVLNNGNILIAGGYNAFNQDDQFSIDDGTTTAQQNQGTHGYLDGVEMFNPLGGRVAISGKDSDLLFYRNSSHGTLLKPNSDVHLLGGYGNIPVTYFDPSPTLITGSYINLTTIGLTSSTISGGEVNFALNEELSRTVSGRIIDGDIFFPSPTLNATTGLPIPSIAIENVKVYVQCSTATIDGLPVVKDSGGTGGEFKNTVQLQNPGAAGPASTVVFAPLDVSTYDTLITATLLNLAIDPLPAATKTTLLSTSTLTTDIAFTLPEIYIGATVTGRADLQSGMISDTRGRYSLTLGKDGVVGGTATFTGAVTETFVSGERKGLVNAPAVHFTGLTGILTNTTNPAATLATGIDAGGQELVGITLSVYFTATRINLTKSSSLTNYVVGGSTLVVREMIFADDLGYNPADSSWSFNPSSPFYPVFNNSAFLTTANDMMSIGGSNCETNPNPNPSALNWCSRRTNVNRRFDPVSGEVTYINQNVTQWPAAASLTTKRAFHTSTLLPNGNILTCGGANDTDTLSSCELYDKTVKKWAFVGSMNYARANHTATLLANGNVLLVGGTISASTAVVNTAEIYYPDTKRCLITEAMITPRADHTATLLPDGNVLVAAGNSGNSYSNSSEIYITTTSKWQAVTDTLGTARAQHTATLLKNGTVLVVGGINSLNAVDTAEIYNPLTRQWNGAPDNLNDKRYSHTANLLRDGRVLVMGGSSGLQALASAEIYDGTNWIYTRAFPAGIHHGNDMVETRSNHTSTLLPNGKILVTGGEAPGLARDTAEGYDVDFSTWQQQGTMEKRARHTTVLMEDGSLMNIGGFDGSKYLNSTEKIYFSDTPDINGLSASTNRQPRISTGTIRFDRGQRATLISDTTNFHGLTEASGGGAGAMNASFSNPRVYLQAVDNPSGFLTDLTTRLYTLYDSTNNTNWERTLSSITITMPATSGEMPYGWYHLRVASNGQFSAAHTVQVTIPRPSGLTTIPVGSVQGSTSVQWTWNQGTLLPAENDGYTVFASSDNVFISTVPFGASAVYNQEGLPPNTMISIKVAGYNTGGYGAFQKSTTYYTLAVAPQNLTVDYSSFETAGLSWDPMRNSPLTIYEVSMSEHIDFLPAEDVFTPVPFNDRLTSTSTIINQLNPNQLYYFRVRAMNTDGIVTDYDNAYMTGAPVSTVTVGNISNLTGTPLTMSSINWSWDASSGATFYEAYDVSAGTTSAVFVGSTTVSSFDHINLSTNTAYTIAISAGIDDSRTPSGPVRGPMTVSAPVYTLAVQPLPGVPAVFTAITTTTFKLNWIANGNPSSTTYMVGIATYVVTSADDVNAVNFIQISTVIGISQVISGLTPNMLYSAGILSMNGAGLATDPIVLGSAYTKAQAPTNFGPTDIALSGVSLAWDTGANSAQTTYEVRGTTTPGFVTGVTTYVPFSMLYTTSTLTLNGLLTATSYYFDVAAMNGNDEVTARTRSVPAVYTLSGPSGAPGGSLGGSSQVGSDVTIEGTLPNGRKVSLIVPAGSFESPTSLAISMSATNSCIQGAIPLVEVAIYTQNNAQPQVPITLKIAYTTTESGAGIRDNLKDLVLARYNPASGECLPLETKIDQCFANEGQWPHCITAKLNHFSVFQLMINAAAANLSTVRAYPNPFYTNRGQGFITIDRLPASAKVKIYTLSGDKVWDGTASTTGVLTWGAINKSGVLVGSGIYLAAIESGVGKKVIKIAVER